MNEILTNIGVIILWLVAIAAGAVILSWIYTIVMLWWYERSKNK